MLSVGPKKKKCLRYCSLLLDFGIQIHLMLFTVLMARGYVEWQAVHLRWRQCNRYPDRTELSECVPCVMRHDCTSREAGVGGDGFGQMPASLAQCKSHREFFHECQLANEDTSGRDPADVRILVSTRPLVVGWKNGVLW